MAREFKAGIYSNSVETEAGYKVYDLKYIPEIKGYKGMVKFGCCPECSECKGSGHHKAYWSIWGSMHDTNFNLKLIR